MRIWQPRLIIPADERVIACLHALVRQARSSGSSRLDAAALATIIASLCAPEQFDAMLLKSSTLALARTLGVRVPEGCSVALAEAATTSAERIGFPVYVKRSFSWGGQGVALCRDKSEVAAAMASARPRSQLPFRKRLKALLHRNWYPTGTAIDVQKSIAGQPAMYCGIAVEGKLVAGFAGFARQTGVPNGPSSIVSLGEHEEMQQASAAMIAALGATGFVSFDFMIESGTGYAYLIECNPRPIPVCHLGARIGVDLCVALAAELRAEPQKPTAAIRAEDIRLFPQEWQREPADLADSDVYLDVPWDDPALLRAMVGAPHPEKLIAA
jgi:predicted ATP-grasp superfamily ATP-dependent carboligase